MLLTMDPEITMLDSAFTWMAEHDADFATRRIADGVCVVVRVGSVAGEGIARRGVGGSINLGPAFIVAVSNLHRRLARPSPLAV
jgi:hypothetical protein